MPRRRARVVSAVELWSALQSDDGRIALALALLDKKRDPMAQRLEPIALHGDRLAFNGRMRHQFRRKGCRRFMLKGKVGSAEFMAHYAELLAASEGPSQ
jgi:hypothetical protein